MNVEYIAQFFHKPNRYIPEHNHACYELVYFRTGTGETVVEKNQTLVYSPGTYAIYPPFSYHTESHRSDTHVLCLGFRLDNDSKIVPEPGIYADPDSEVYSLIVQIFQEIEKKKPYSEMFSQACLMQLLVLHQRNLGGLSTENLQMKYIVRFINENYMQDIRLSALAEMSGYSYDYFRHLFTQEVGISPKSYILHKRISYAKQLLKESGSSISEIASSCGFSDISEFSTAFRRKVGISPLKYRQDRDYVHDDVDTLKQGRNM